MLKVETLVFWNVMVISYAVKSGTCVYRFLQPWRWKQQFTP